MNHYTYPSKSELKRLATVDPIGTAERLALAIEALEACEKVLTIIVDCSGEVFHANDVKPERDRARAALEKLK